MFGGSDPQAPTLRQEEICWAETETEREGKELDGFGLDQFQDIRQITG
jgi:hypothetical protein